MRRLPRSLGATLCATFFLTCGSNINSPAFSATTALNGFNTARPTYVQRNVPGTRRTPTAAKFIYIGADNPGLAVYNAVSGKPEVSLPNHRAALSIATNSIGDAYTTGDTNQFHSINAWTPELKEIPPTIKSASPSALAVGGNGNIYVSTLTYQKGSEIHTYTPQGIPTSPTITNVAAQGPAVDANNKIYALVSPNNGQNMTVLTYLPDGTPTTPTIQISGCYPGGTSTANLAVDLSGKIYVAAICHSKNFEGVLTFTPEGSPTSPTINAPDQLAGITVDSAGKIYVLGDSTLTTFLPNGSQTTPTITGLSGLFSIAVY
jgi:hypothetical protein